MKVFKLKLSKESVRRVCVANRLYQCGDNRQYGRMLRRLDFPLSPDDLADIVNDIVLHSAEDPEEIYTSDHYDDLYVNLYDTLERMGRAVICEVNR